MKQAGLIVTRLYTETARFLWKAMPVQVSPSDTDTIASDATNTNNAVPVFVSDRVLSRRKEVLVDLLEAAHENAQRQFDNFLRR
jgi:hypothetical protein